MVSTKVSVNKTSPGEHKPKSPVGLRKQKTPEQPEVKADLLHNMEIHIIFLCLSTESETIFFTFSYINRFPDSTVPLLPKL